MEDSESFENLKAQMATVIEELKDEIDIPITETRIDINSDSDGTLWITIAFN